MVALDMHLTVACAVSRATPLPTILERCTLSNLAVSDMIIEPIDESLIVNELL
jgi:hypothetical protein